jgi:aspartate carbamoyltransferase regulatory subunit
MFCPYPYGWGHDYGALATPYFILFNEHVAGSITSQGRELTMRMDTDNVEYWTKLWHLDFELHKKMGLKNIKEIGIDEKVSIYADTDSLFVSFEPVMNKCTWRNNFLDNERLEGMTSKVLIIEHRQQTKIDNPNVKSMYFNDLDEFEKTSGNSILWDEVTKGYDRIVVDGAFVKNRTFNNKVLPVINQKIYWNWQCELDFIQGFDHFRYGQYFKDCLDKYASEYGVVNKEDFELERISESIVNISKKKYIQHILFEDGIDYDRLNYIFPKGVELVRSSTPLFAREKIVDIVKYIFAHPDDFNIKNLLKQVKDLRREFELADMDDISMQTSVNKYSEKVLEDKNRLLFVSGAHYAVKAAAYHNHLLHQNKELQSKYEFIKSGMKVKCYYCKNNRIAPVFAFQRGSFPIEMAPEIDYDTQFAKTILSPINSIIQPLGMPEITKRLSVVMDIFSGY